MLCSLTLYECVIRIAVIVHCIGDIMSLGWFSCITPKHLDDNLFLYAFTTCLKFSFTGKYRRWNTVLKVFQRLHPDTHVLCASLPLLNPNSDFFYPLLCWIKPPVPSRFFIWYHINFSKTCKSTLPLHNSWSPSDKIPFHVGNAPWTKILGNPDKPKWLIPDGNAQLCSGKLSFRLAK